MPHASIISACAACGQSTTPPEVIGDVAPTQAGQFSVNVFRLAHCPVCEVIRLEPTPTSDDLRLMYEESIQFADATYTDPERVAAILEYYGTCLDNHQLTPGPGEASLEVGAGLAWVSRAIKQREATAITWAQDVTRECADACTWVDHYAVGQMSLLDPEQRFRLISLTHVIEHLADPRSALCDLAARLHPDGRLFITAPYRPTDWLPGDAIDAWQNYSYLHVPAHISYLSQRWFELVAAQCGLQVLHWDAGHEQGQAFEAVLGT
jgi:2-polyprenyl-3-methyl-5-hydroxy-6-metoxy-1,4-benzoquinol methylase